ncbi:MAG: guanylate kinase [Sphingomonadales bacterium]
MPDETKRRGLMLILSSPSGAGKTTLSRKLLDEDKDTVLSISMTTRPPRNLEKEGRDYFFVSENEFTQVANKDGFLEYAKVFGFLYGTPKQKVEDSLAKGKDVLFDIDWQGTQQIIQKKSSDMVSIFILPPSINELRKRLISRGQDSTEQIEKRMETAHGELSHWAEYDYVIVNDKFDDCIKEIKSILEVERKKRNRQDWLIDYMKNLMSQEI